MKALINYSCLLLIALCIGILGGMSISPVIQTILTSILGIGVTLVSIWIGLSIDDKNLKNKTLANSDLSIFPLAIFVLGITVGSMTGIYIRTHNLLSDKDVNIYNRSKEHARDSANQRHDISDRQRTALFSTYQTTCDIVNSTSGAQLILMLRSLGDDHINTLIDSCNSDPIMVKKLLLLLCK